MAVVLTTLYGAMLANVIFLPMKITLEQNTAKEVVFREMILSALRAYQEEKAQGISRSITCQSFPTTRKVATLPQDKWRVAMAVSEAEEVVVEDGFTKTIVLSVRQRCSSMDGNFCRHGNTINGFFVLILSFAEFNVPKFKQISGSLKNAFGIQRMYQLLNNLKEQIILSLNFSPSPAPAVTENITQQTTLKKSLN